ncbi:MAG TPA: M1 family aminopeptidase [Candidatus Polarisedimenticolia bacterium]|nr:M1 family aminopeptidase [Candidatus Polarisedimenticolia bacterium]
MLGRIFLFEIRYQLRQPLFWISAILFFLMTFGAVTTDVIVVGGSIGSVNRNAPFVLMQLLLVMTLIGTFLTTAFAAGSVYRDFESQADAIFFSLPLRKAEYLFGRLSGALVVSWLVYVAVLLGVFIGGFMPWLEPERIGPFQMAPYLFSMLAFVLPNVIITGSIFFALATLTRSLFATYAGVVVFFVGYAISGIFLGDLENRTLAALVDPYGFGAFELVTRYWTVIEKNTGAMPLRGILLQNRLIWMGVAVAFLVFTWARFRFTTGGSGGTRRKRRVIRWEAAGSEPGANPLPAAPLPVSAQRFDRGASWKQFWRQTRIETLGALRGAPFQVMLFAGLLNVFGSIYSLDDLYGTKIYPVTHVMLRAITGAFGLFLFLVLTFYSGEMVWRERSLRMSETLDALPVPTWVGWASKLCALGGIILAMLVAVILTCIGFQASTGYSNFEIPLYLKGLFLVALPQFLFYAALCLFVQVLVNNKFLGWLASSLFYIAGFILPALRLEHSLYRFGTAPNAPYSDMNGYGHFVQPLLWFYLYWGFICAALVALGHLLWVRGSETSFLLRLRVARQRLTRPASAALVATLAGAAGAGAFIFYNTNILNQYRPTKTRFDRQARYEKQYRQYLRLPQPRVTDVEADVDIHPETRSVAIRGRYSLKNKTGAPIDRLHLYLNPDVIVRSLEPSNARLDQEDKDLGYRIYRLEPPLAPGAEMRVAYDLAIENRGFVNNGSRNEFVANGTFFNSGDFFPHVGYSKTGELDDPNERRRRGLPPVQRFPKIDDTAARGDNYTSGEADWVRFATTVSTSPDQLAIAPGYLKREWTANGRRYFRYEMDSPIFDFFAYLSARYAVKRDHWNDVAIEVDYHPGHAYNVDRMIEAVKKSLEYFTANFGPYQHRQVRIVEFPRYATFAQSFPNTIPFSESIGFIARLDDRPDAIDYVSYVTAHEVAHQWWAHQVMGGNVQGATLMSETMSQYSALMVMEHMYGRDKMRRFLKYELDRYLQGRGGERVEELPSYLVEDQPYIHYRKGSLVMYALKDYVGEEPLNRALSQYVKAVAFQEPPYTYSIEFLDYVQNAVPPDRRVILDDLFRTITLYENKAVAATWSRREDGKYVVRIEVGTAKYRADGQGKETQVPLDDWIDFGVFGDRDPKGPSEGRLLALEKRHVDGASSSFEMLVDQEPRKAGIDPFNKLIDRNPDDNLVAALPGDGPKRAAAR